MGRHSALEYAGTPTQVVHPWRSVLRTVFQAVVGLAAAWAIIVQAVGLDETIPWVATSLVITGAITRFMNSPAANAILERFLPFLATGVHTEVDYE